VVIRKNSKNYNLVFKIKFRPLDIFYDYVRNDYNHENKNHNGICDWGHGYELWHL